MSVLRANAPAHPAHPGGDAPPRVRDLARQALARMVFSATVSITVAMSLLVLAYALGR